MPIGFNLSAPNKVEDKQEDNWALSFGAVGTRVRRARATRHHAITVSHRRAAEVCLETHQQTGISMSKRDNMW